MYVLSLCSDTAYYEKHPKAWKEAYFQRTWDSDKWTITADGMTLSLFTCNFCIYLLAIISTLYTLSGVSIQRNVRNASNVRNVRNLTMQIKFNFNNFARVCHNSAACQRHMPSSLAAVIGLSNNDVISLRSVRFLRPLR